MLVPLIGLQRDLVFQPAAKLGLPAPFGRALVRTGESSRSIVAGLMFASFSLSGKASPPYSFLVIRQPLWQRCLESLAAKLIAPKANPLEHQPHLLRWISQLRAAALK
jgi:hypothetical protein